MTTSSEALAYLRDLLRRRSAIVLDGTKDYLVESRLAPVARESGLASIDALLLEVVKRNETGPAARKVIEAMTTNETSFFRDIHPWETLRKTLLPELVRARRAQRRLRIWCAAASTGQEPYTIAMIIREHFPELASWDIQLLGTDINTAVLERAAEGVFRQHEVNRGLPAPMLVKYFERAGLDWQIRPEVRRMVVFKELNLIGRWSLFSTQDLVFMRNVLIYFDVATKREILRRTRENLEHDGYLVLGGAETTWNIDEGYVPVQAGATVVYQPNPLDQQRRTAGAGR